MGKEKIRQALYEKYIEPTKRKRPDSVGIEIEMPIVNLSREAVDFDVIHRITEEFIRDFNFEYINRDDEGNIYNTGSAVTGDYLSYDCSYNNLELSLGKADNICELNRRFGMYYDYLQEKLNFYNYTLTGMGVNPYKKYNHNVPIPNGRYRMLFHHLGTADRYSNIPMFFHEYPSYGTFASASQVQLDVDYDDLVDTINVFSKIEPIKAVLFSNAVLLGEHEELLCARDLFWENSTHGINPHNVGMFDCELEDIDDLQSYIESTSMYCVERDDKYINFRPVNVMEYFDSPVIKGEYFDGTKYQDINVVPRLSDIKYLRTFKFEDLTFRGTIEFRSCCCQPISDAMTVAAFHLGLKERLKELQELMEQDHVIYHHGYSASELRKMFNMRKYPDFIDETKLYELCRKVIDIAAAGLKDRGFGEEEYLTPLYERINKRSNPAKWLLSSMENGVSLEDMIVQYSNRDFCTI